jgi:hypothetical protein
MNIKNVKKQNIKDEGTIFYSSTVYENVPRHEPSGTVIDKKMTTWKRRFYKSFGVKPSEDDVRQHRNMLEKERYHLE